MTLIRLIQQKLAALVGRAAETGGSEEEEEAEETYQWTGTKAVQITAVQVRMARAAVGWGIRELAEKAGVTASTITRIENGSGAKPSTITSIRAALESAGIEFIAEYGEGVGVKLRRPPREAERTRPRQPQAGNDE